MPLVLMCGLPCAGKSRRMEELRAALRDKYGVCSQVIGEEVSCSGGTAMFRRDVLFNSEQMEKESRGHLRSEAARLLSREKEAVIVDSPNYIKGYRYELFCLAKANGCTHCVIHCAVPPDTAWQWNRDKIEDGSAGYSRATFEALVARFEAPDSRNRWDCPLFTLHPDDPLPSEEIYERLFRTKALPANQSTQSQPLLDTNFLYNLDKVTQDMVYGVLEAQKGGGGVGEELSLPGATAKLRLDRRYTPTELARLKRQFVLYTKMHPVDSGEKCANTFIRYLMASGNIE